MRNLVLLLTRLTESNLFDALVVADIVDAHAQNSVTRGVLVVLISWLSLRVLVHVHKVQHKAARKQSARKRTTAGAVAS